MNFLIASNILLAATRIVMLGYLFIMSRRTTRAYHNYKWCVRTYQERTVLIQQAAVAVRRASEAVGDRDYERVRGQMHRVEEICEHLNSLPIEQ